MSWIAVGVIGAVFLINIPFGYWRSNTRPFSGEWILAVHSPVPISIAMRLFFLGWSWLLLPVFIAAYALGQFSGGQFRNLLNRSQIQLSSVLPLDLVRALRRESRRESQ